MNYSRKAFLGRGLLALGAAPFLQAQAQSPSPNLQGSAAPEAQIDAALIKDFVIAGHAKLDIVTEMLGKHPALVNATWGWGSGDYETALGGASHMGRADIAEFLLSKGARLDLFAAAMLGQLEIVRAAVAAFPAIVQVPGPHGIPLLAHAEKGGAKSVVEFLRPLTKSPSKEKAP